MKRVINFVNTYFYADILKNGYRYIPDNDLFVLDELSSLFSAHNPEFKIKDFKRVERKTALLNILDNLTNRKVEIFTKDVKIKFISLVEYQIFLDEKGFDNRYRRKVRGLIKKALLNEHKELKVKRDNYFYNPNKVELNFIDSINDLILKLKKITKNNKNFFYRGHSNLDWNLIPSIYRKKKWINNEHRMFREIIIRNPEEFIKTKSTFEKLTIMQHYGLPTRLLDITKNPLVALFFACSEKSQSNSPGEVITFNPKPEIIKYFDSDTVSILSNLSKAERNFKIIKDKKLFKKNIIGLKLLHIIKEEKPYFLAKINPLDLEKALIVKPINNNERIKRQQGYFFIFGINSKIDNPADINSIFHKENIIPKFIIEEFNKPQILHELEAIGISSDMLFPEIEKGTEYIKSEYEKNA